MSIGLSIGQSFLVAIPFTFGIFMVISYWVNKITGDFPGLWMILTLIATYAAFSLILLFAPETILVAALITALGIIILTLLLAQIG
jgi:hypothetical protein